MPAQKPAGHYKFQSTGFVVGSLSVFWEEVGTLS